MSAPEGDTLPLGFAEQSPSSRLLSRRGIAATAACAAVVLSPFAAGATWRTPSTGLWVAGAVTALALGFPKLGFSQTAPPSSSGRWGQRAVRWLFGAALFSPFAAILFAAASSAGGAPLGLALALAAACGFAAILGASRAQGSAAYGALTLVTALTLAGPLAPSTGRWIRSLSSPAVGPAGGAAEGAGTLGAGSLRRVRLDLRGPLVEASIGLEGYPALTIRAELLPGERVEARAWMVGPQVADWFESVSGSVSDGASDGASRGGASASPAGRGFVCPDWARRAGPPLDSKDSDGGGGGDWPALLAAAASAVASCSVLRSNGGRAGRQSLLLLLFGAAGTLGAGYLASAGLRMEVQADTQPPIAVLEGRRLSDGGTEWVEARRSFGTLKQPIQALDRAWEGQLEISDPRGAAGTTLDLTGGGSRWGIVAADASVAMDWRGPYEPGLRLLMPAVNTWGSFAEAWERAPSGAWTALGPLALGAKIAAGSGPLEPSAAPPAWCTEGLSGGGSAFIGRLQEPLAGTRATWVRLSGFRIE